jgi:hypothetical protein
LVADHDRGGVLGRDDVRRKRLSEDRVGVFQVCLPEVAPLPHHGLFAGDAVDQYVEALVLATDAPEECLYVGLDGVVDANCDCRSTSRVDHRGGFVDRLATSVRRRSALDAPSSAVHRGTSLAKRASDATSRPACGTGDDGDRACQRSTRLRGRSRSWIVFRSSLAGHRHGPSARV